MTKRELDNRTPEGHEQKIICSKLERILKELNALPPVPGGIKMSAGDELVQSDLLVVRSNGNGNYQWFEVPCTDPRIKDIKPINIK